MLKPAEIGIAGEIHVTNWLKNNGYTCYRNTQLPGSTDIQAKGQLASLLVQVKTAIKPELPAELSSGEKAAIIARANKLRWQAWSARLQINHEGEILGNIIWKKLN